MKINSIQILHILRVSSWFYLSLYIIFFILTSLMSLSITVIQVNNLLTLGMFLLPLIPFLWFPFIKINWVRISSFVVYFSLLTPIYLISSLVFLFTFFDVIEWNNNGFRPVFEKKLPDKKWLIIFRTPDEGALGGDHVCPAIVKKVLPGLQKRIWLKESDFNFDFNSDSNYVIIDNVKYKIPKEEVLRQKGNI